MNDNKLKGYLVGMIICTLIISIFTLYQVDLVRTEIAKNEIWLQSLDIQLANALDGK